VMTAQLFSVVVASRIKHHGRLLRKVIIVKMDKEKFTLLANLFVKPFLIRFTRNSCLNIYVTKFLIRKDDSNVRTKKQMKKKLKKNLNSLLKAVKLNLIIEERELKNK